MYQLISNMTQYNVVITMYFSMFIEARDPIYVFIVNNIHKICFIIIALRFRNTNYNYGESKKNQNYNQCDFAHQKFSVDYLRLQNIKNILRNSIDFSAI